MMTRSSALLHRRPHLQSIHQLHRTSRHMPGIITTKQPVFMAAPHAGSRSLVMTPYTDATWALDTTSKVEVIFGISSANASTFVQCLNQKLPSTAQLEGMLTKADIIAAVKVAVSHEMQIVRSEMRLASAVLVIGLLLLLLLGSTPVGAGVVACVLKVLHP